MSKLTKGPFTCRSAIDNPEEFGLELRELEHEQSYINKLKSQRAKIEELREAYDEESKRAAEKEQQVKELQVQVQRYKGYLQFKQKSDQLEFQNGRLASAILELRDRFQTVYAQLEAVLQENHNFGREKFLRLADEFKWSQHDNKCLQEELSRSNEAVEQLEKSLRSLQKSSAEQKKELNELVQQSKEEAYALRRKEEELSSRINELSLQLGFLYKDNSGLQNSLDEFRVEFEKAYAMILQAKDENEALCQELEAQALQHGREAQRLGKEVEKLQDSVAHYRQIAKQTEESARKSMEETEARLKQAEAAREELISRHHQQTFLILERIALMEREQRELLNELFRAREELKKVGLENEQLRTRMFSEFKSREQRQRLRVGIAEMREAEVSRIDQLVNEYNKCR